MTYVFFDCECANCLNGEGKICSLGYVKTTPELEILRKKDILIDPDAEFLLGNAKSGKGIHLAYPLFRFKWAHTFPAYYDEIKRLFTNDQDTIAFGFAVKQDISYLLYTCKRYNLRTFDFRFFDIQLLEQRIHNKENPSSLDHLIKEYGLEELTYHRSDDDAFMTMEVLKGIVAETGKTILELIQEHQEAMCDVSAYQKELEERKRQKEEKRKLAEKVNGLYAYLDTVRYTLSEHNSYFYQKKIFFEYFLLIERFDEIKKISTKLKKGGALITRNPTEADIVIVKKKASMPRTLPVKENARIMEYTELKKKRK